jgi:hypothetical protein
MVLLGSNLKVGFVLAPFSSNKEPSFYALTTIAVPLEIEIIGTATCPWLIY